MRADNNTKEKILSAAVELMSSKGYRGTTLQEIAQCVGITQAALYYYFESKEAILIEIARTAVKDAQTAVGNALKENASAQKRFADALQAYTYVVLGNKGMKIYFDEVRELSDPAKQVVKREEAELVQALAEAFRECQKAGMTAFTSVTPRFVTLAVIGMSSWANRWYDDSGTLSKKEVAELITRIALHGLFK
ncbi:MAG: TetR family transcriptional regulator [Firmicutes bacterium]|nr:TetR family transcriptional regulator [Bacillota bacterium]